MHTLMVSSIPDIDFTLGMPTTRCKNPKAAARKLEATTAFGRSAEVNTIRHDNETGKKQLLDILPDRYEEQCQISECMFRIETMILDVANGRHSQADDPTGTIIVSARRQGDRLS